MNKIILWSAIMLVPGFQALGQPVYEVEPIVVTGSRIPTKLPEATRDVTVITSEEIEALPASSVPELLNHLIDVRQRGSHGIQADLSIRGTSFEQVLVLIDGVPVSDPQTGHHSLDIPLTLEDIEQIEILRGHGSSLYGANAFGGVVNIITKKVGKGSKSGPVGIRGSYGNYRTYTLCSANTFQLGDFGGRFSLEKQKSDGYRYDTDFENAIISCGAGYGDLIGCSFGILDKNFGAYHFYAPFPSREKTRTRFVESRIGPRSVGKLRIEPTGHYREHSDEFILDRESPDDYKNYHTNYRYGGGVTCYLGSAACGCEAYEEKIKSSGIRGGAEAPALGDHRRLNTAIYGEYGKSVKNLRVSAGARADRNSQYGTYVSPSASLGYVLFDKLKLRGSAGKSFRAPSFTELYYEDPANVGDSLLKAEEAWSYEIGADFKSWMLPFETWAQISTTLFTSEQENLIDWVWSNQEGKWMIKNIRRSTRRGIESSLKFKEKAGFLALGYTFVQVIPHSAAEPDYVSKYALNYPEHQVSLRLKRALLFDVVSSMGAILKKRAGMGGIRPTGSSALDMDETYYALNAQISKRMGAFLFSVSGTNLLDARYEEITGVEMPGRWLTASMKMGM